VSRTDGRKDGLEETVMAWLVLVVAGLLEAAWASVLPATRGLTRPWPTALFVVLLAASMVGLARATESIPIGTAYGVWVGIGAVGAVIVGVVAHDDPLTTWRVFFLVLLVASIIGLKVTHGG
jgi:quaternary ammonium compound-resistance protein SugE